MTAHDRDPGPPAAEQLDRELSRTGELDRELARALGRPEPARAAGGGAYVDALDRRPVLPPERERALVTAAKQGDLAARALLVEAFLPLIASVARTYRNLHVQRMELPQEGVVGLLRALEGFDPDRGVPFWAYASWWVRQAMQQLVAELSERTGLTRDQVDDLLATERALRSLEEPVPGHDGMVGTFGDTGSTARTRACARSGSGSGSAASGCGRSSAARSASSPPATPPETAAGSDSSGRRTNQTTVARRRAPDLHSRRDRPMTRDTTHGKESRMHGCSHDGFHSGEGRYSAETKTLRYIVTCDTCGAELREVTVEQYHPDFDPHGNDAYLAV